MSLSDEWMINVRNSFVQDAGNVL